jgi:hypothetical protein
MMRNLLFEKPWVDDFDAMHARLTALGKAEKKTFKRALKAADLFVDARTNHSLVLSIYLDHASRVRSNAGHDEQYHAIDKQALYDVRLPQYVYVVEISTVALMDGGSAKRVLGEAIFDPTIGAHLSEALVLLRLPGFHHTHRGRIESRPSLTGTRKAWLVRNFRPVSS